MAGACGGGGGGGRRRCRRQGGGDGARAAAPRPPCRVERAASERPGARIFASSSGHEKRRKCVRSLRFELFPELRGGDASTKPRACGWRGTWATATLSEAPRVRLPRPD